MWNQYQDLPNDGTDWIYTDPTEGRADSAAGEAPVLFKLLQSYYGGDRGCLRRGAREEQRGAVVVDVVVGGAGLGLGWSASSVGEDGAHPT